MNAINALIYIVLALAYTAIWASLYGYWEHCNREFDVFSFVASFLWWLIIPLVLYARFVRWSAARGRPFMAVIYGDH